MKVLADTSVWVDHLRSGNDELSCLLAEGHVLIHPFIIGELACGHLKNREAILELLAALPKAKVAEHQEALQLVTRHRLAGRGMGWIDIHLVASARLTHCRLWTLDRALQAAALAFDTAHKAGL